MASVDEGFKIPTSNHTYVGLDKDSEGEWKGSFSFIQGADTQFGMIETFLRKSDVSCWDEEIKLTKKAIAAVNKMEPKPKFFVICGDMLDAWPATQAETRALQEKDFKKLFCDLDPSIPLVCVCGNHDIGNTPTPDTVAMYRKSFGDDYFSFWVGGVFFIVINSQYYFDASQVSQVTDLVAQQDQWLDEQLEIVSQAKHGIVFQHVPWFLNNVDEPCDHYFNLDPVIRRKMLDKFKKAGIKTVFCGHYHRNAGGFDDDLEVVVTSAIGAQLGDDKHGFRVVKVSEKKVDHQYYALEDVPEKINLDD